MSTEEPGSDAGFPENSIFHPDVVAQYTLLTLLQIRDVLAVIASNVSKESEDEFEALIDRYHERGSLYLPPPFLGAPSEVSEVTEE